MILEHFYNLKSFDLFRLIAHLQVANRASHAPQFTYSDRKKTKRATNQIPKSERKKKEEKCANFFFFQCNVFSILKQSMTTTSGHLVVPQTL